MKKKWQEKLRGNPLPWLLGSENPSVRYMLLRQIMELPDNDGKVKEAHQAIASYPPVAALLSQQHEIGYWFNKDYYLPKHRGTFWTLSLLADIGLTKNNHHVRRGCEYIYNFQRKTGAFCRRRRIAGKGVVWDRTPAPCTHARIVRFLLQFGLAKDPHTRRGIDWMLANRHEDGMWHCRQKDPYGCLRATHDVLRVAVLYPKIARRPEIKRAARVMYELLMKPRISRYHVPDMWHVLEYPIYTYSAISILDTLGRLGYSLEMPKVAEVFDFIISRQLPNGTWPLDYTTSSPPFDVGKIGKPNKWITLDVLKLIKLLY